MSVPRAVWFVALRTVQLRDVHLESPGPGQLLVANELSAISAGTELLAYRGLVPAELRPDLPTVEGDFGFPLKFGYASVGRVRAIGPGVQNLAVGQRVFAFHPHQTEFVIDAALVV